MVRASRGFVASPHTLATRSGVRALERGGNAVDAAVAASATLAVVYPHMAGIGGDLFALVWSDREGVACLNASGRSAGAASPEWYRARGLSSIPDRGPHAALTVPGTVAGWAELLSRHGRLDLAETLADAAELARSGFPVSRSLAAWLIRDREILEGIPATREMFLQGGRAAPEGEELRFGSLADTLDDLRAHGAAHFYGGDLGRRLGTILSEAGSPLSAVDFAAYAPSWSEPATATYRGWTVATAPPNSQGFALLEILRIVEPLKPLARGDRSPEYVGLLAAAARAALEDRDRVLGDPEFSDVGVAALLDEARLERVRRTLGPAAVGSGMPGDTICVAAVDDQGRLVSLIQSLYFDFGSAFVAGPTGVLMQNRGVSFSLEGGPNVLAPRKRPAHTLMPVIAWKDGEGVLAAGTMGGDGQPQTMAALCTRILEQGAGLQEAIDAPRWLYGRTWGTRTRALTLEDAFPEETRSRLAREGWPVSVVPRWSETLGHAQAVFRTARGELTGAADPRSDGSAEGGSSVRYRQG